MTTSPSDGRYRSTTPPRHDQDATPVLIEKCCQFDDSIDDSNVEVTSFDGILVDLCKDIRAPLIIRGIRAISDFEYEYAIALLNKKLAPETETVFLMSKGEYSFISSNMVREIASYHGDISSFVPPFVNNKLLEIFSQ